MTFRAGTTIKTDESSLPFFNRLFEAIPQIDADGAAGYFGLLQGVRRACPAEAS